MTMGFEHTNADFALPSDRERRIHTVHITDKYINGDQPRIIAQLNDRVADGFYGDTTVDLARKRTSRVDHDNPSTRWMYDNVPGFADWHALVPTAAALEPIYNPRIDILANDKPFTPEMRAWMCNIDDAIGIRSRAEVMQGIAMQEVSNSKRRQRWVSLACGTATPVISTLQLMKEQDMMLPEVMLADYQRKALTIATESAERAGVGDVIKTKRTNILNRSGITSQHQRGAFYKNIVSSISKLPAESYDIADAVGMTEYLKIEDWQFNYDKVIHSKLQMAGAVSFLKNAFELVRSGGILIVGNMRETHPQLGFTLNVIQWPHIQPRSIDQMYDIFEQAGLGDDIDTYCPDDNVYALYSIRKH